MIHYKQEMAPIQVETTYECDRCHRQASSSKDSWIVFNEFLLFDRIGGYGSVFGDGNRIQLDLCQECVKDVLGRWIRVTDAYEQEE